MAAVRFSRKQVFLAEGIMMELVFASGSDPARVNACRRRDLAAIW